MNSDIQLKVHSEVAILPNPMLSEAFYEDCIKFASRIIRLEKCNLYFQPLTEKEKRSVLINYPGGNMDKKLIGQLMDGINYTQTMKFSNHLQIMKSFPCAPKEINMPVL
jgi:hypothetical protein